MTYNQLKLWTKKLTFYLEFILAMFIALSVVVGMVDLGRYLILIFQTNPIDTYEVLQKFLGHVLMLVVGVELIVMLVFHSPGSVIEVLLYAVARKVLIGNQGMVEFMIGIIAIAAIFAIRRFLFIENVTNSTDHSATFSAEASTKHVKELMGLDIPEEMGSTIGEVVCYLAKYSYRVLLTGAEYDILNARVRILKMKDGVIEKVLLTINEG